MATANDGYSLEPKDGKYQCACCLEYTLDSLNDYDVCPLCGWEDDDIQNVDIDYAGGANNLSIRQIRALIKQRKPNEQGGYLFPADIAPKFR